MRASHFLFAGLVVVALGSAAACGSSSSSSPSTVDELRGEYKATTSGEISDIRFLDATHYSMITSNCANGVHSCVQNGSYVMSSAYDSVTFTSSTGQVSSMPFQIMSKGSPQAPNTLTSSSHPLGVSLTGDAGSLGGGSGSSGALLLAELIALIEAFMLGQQAFSSGSDSGTPPATTTPFTGADAGVFSFDANFDSGFDGGDGGDASDAAATQTIPVAVAVGTDGNPRATVQVSVGGGTPFTAVLDTGSCGLRVAPGVVPDSAWTVTTTSDSVTYGSDLSVSGLVATADVTVGGISTNGPISLVKVTSATCVSGHPNCSASTQDAGSFRFGDQYGAILGVGLRAKSNGVASPFAAMGQNQQYFLRLPPQGSSNGVAEIDPSATEIAALATTVSLTSTGAATPNGVQGWDDTQVPFCMNNYCANALLDTGAQTETVSGLQMNDYTSLGVAIGATSVPSGIAIEVTINQGISWAFTVGNPPQLGVDSIQLSSSGTTDNLGLAPFRQFDMFYDYSAGNIGLESKQPQ